MEEPDGKNVKVQRWSQQPYCATLRTVGGLTMWLLDRPGFLSLDLFCLQMWQWLLVVRFFCTFSLSSFFVYVPVVLGSMGGAFCPMHNLLQATLEEVK